jgi:hypothetical protein
VQLVPPHSPSPATSQRIIHPSRNTPLAVFDAGHGQPNWAQTGFASREMHTNFVGVMEALCRLGCLCAPTGDQPLAKYLARAKLLVVPPPTGYYNARKESWAPLAGSLLTGEEIGAILGFLRQGGRLFLSAYRFGDSFTNTNLRELVSPLGCLLNDDVVIDLHTLRATHPLQAYFDTPRSCLPSPWFLDGVATVRWRVMATFTILPGTAAWPVALSPGGSCISFNRAHRRISFASLPLAVAGLCGKGRFVLVGGPHAFECGTFGLLNLADNARFLNNLLRWLLDDGPVPATAGEVPAACEDLAPELCRVESRGTGQRTVAYVERQLRSTGVLRALHQAKWLP